MEELDDIKSGWEFMAQILGAEIASGEAVSEFVNNIKQNNLIDTQNIQIQKINDAINQLAKNINEHAYRNLPVEQFKGLVAEEWHAQTYNIDAISKDSTHRAQVLHENGFGSVDIKTNFGKNYGLKYSNTAKDAEAMQAAVNTDTGNPKYQGQERLIASDQVKEAKAIAHRKFLKDIENRPEVASAHKDTEDHLVGTISDDRGIHSKELTAKEDKVIAKEGKEGRFDPEKHGIKKEVKLDHIKIDYLNGALKAGLTAASITAIVQLVPEIYKAIDYLIKNGEIDLNVLKSSGTKLITTSGESFLRGSIAYGLEMAVQNGVFGEALKSVDAAGIGVAVTVVLGTVRNSILVAAGKITPAQMGSNFTNTLVVSAGYLVGQKIGGIIAQALLPQLPGIAYALGSLLGCSVSVLYNIGKNKLISFCVDTGFTCFGLVDQDYRLPEKALHEMGVETIDIPRTQIETVSIERTQIPTVDIDTAQYETVNLTICKRGIIGANRIGYVI